MNMFKINQIGLKLAMAATLALTQFASAQGYFTDTQNGDVNAGFRKTGTYQEQDEMVVYLGNITNFLAVPAGTSINITNYSSKQLTNMCPDNFGNLQWSVFSSFYASGTTFPTTVGTFPVPTCWFTVPRTSPGTQTTAPKRTSSNSQNNLSERMLGVSSGANTISGEIGGASTSTNNAYVVLEPISLDPNNLLTYYIGDRTTSSLGDFYGNGGITYSVEDVTPSSFTSAVVCDFYQDVPNSTASDPGYVDPITGLTNGACYFVGYFTLNPNGSMSFTRASAVSAPAVSAVSASVTNGFASLQVVFSGTASGRITNYVWNFGNGVSATNTTGASVTNTYTASGSYTATLTVYGPGGSASLALGSSITVSAAPKIASVSLTGTNLVGGGTGGIAGVQYRVLSTTNLALPLASWTPILTNKVAGNGTYAFTNSMTKPQAFYLLVSP